MLQNSKNILLKIIYFVVVLFLFFNSTISAQSAQDPQLKADTVHAKRIKVKRNPVQPVVKADTIFTKQGSNSVSEQRTTNEDVGKRKPGYADIIKLNPYYNFYGKPTSLSIQKRPAYGKEAVFYLLCGLMLFFAFIKLFFNKYLQNLFSVFFRISLKQKQMREQLLQAPLPSLLLNIFFVVTSSIYIAFLLKIYRFNVTGSFWWLLVYCVLIVLAVYLVKFLALKFVGWVFNMREASSTYIFIVFLINKLLGIFLMPFLVLIAFSESGLVTIWITLSYIVIFLAFAYRYVSAMGPIRREINVSPLHFFIYLCAFEIIPVILIYKVLFKFFERSF
jgi:hypothetical protein